MEWLIALAVLALIVRVAMIFLCPNVDNFLSGHGYNDSDTYDNANNYTGQNLDKQLNISDSKYVVGPFKANNINYSSLTGVQDD